MKIVVFMLADKVYGVAIEQVREVVRMRKVTPVPDAAGFIEGVISLRGKVIPLINLRKKLNLEIQAAPSNRILVTKLQEQWAGILVDQVEDVVALHPEEVTKPDEMLKGAYYLIGVAKYKGRLVLIADLKELLRGDEQADLQKVREKVEIKKKNPEMENPKL